jgi:hypothetical protein
MRKWRAHRLHCGLRSAIEILQVARGFVPGAGSEQPDSARLREAIAFYGDERRLDWQGGPHKERGLRRAPKPSVLSSESAGVLFLKLVSKMICHPERSLAGFWAKRSRRTCISGFDLCKELQRRQTNPDRHWNLHRARDGGHTSRCSRSDDPDPPRPAPHSGRGRPHPARTCPCGCLPGE